DRLDTIDDRLDTIDDRLDKIEEQIETIKEDTHITREVTNELVKWVEVHSDKDDPFPVNIKAI
ncbi:MAG: hypothetical protein J1F04_02510, partial [Oscillospiraceae bacterium]|nr:hypothetical protein [Oscillospiraceae bacterium]